MKLQFITPDDQLKPYISKLWSFENYNGLVQHGSLIAPNARPKIIIPYTNDIATTDSKKTTICKEGDICFIGIRDVPVTLGTPAGTTGSIGIELTTAGAYKFLNISMNELTNNLFSFTELFGKSGKELQQRIGNEAKPSQKVKIIQDFLIDCLSKANRINNIVDYSVNLLLSSHGLIEVKELEKKTGYSKRYLDMLFKDHLGISPKTYATIIRFQSFYKQWPLQNASMAKDPLDLYYDQSHFIKEFKRYTGLTPGQFAGIQNDFGKYF